MSRKQNARNTTNLSFFSQGDQSKIQSKLQYDQEFILRFTSDALDFYKLIYDYKALQKVEILTFEISEDRKFARYIIQVETSHLSYQITKRYSEFCEWFNLVKIYLDNQTIQSFPPKKYFNNLFGPFLNYRVRAINEFIQSLITNPQPQLVSFSFLDFMEVRRQYIIHQIKLTGCMTNSFLHCTKSNPDEEQIIEFIESMNSGLENLSHTFNDMQNFFVKQKPRLTNESINALFQGCKQYHGLIYTIGSLASGETNSHLICTVALKFMQSLFDYEHNRDAETFIRVFTNLHIKIILQLRLSHHILPENIKQCKQYALRILDVYLTKNNIRKPEQIMGILQENQRSYEEYKRWIQQKQLDYQVVYSKNNKEESNKNKKSTLNSEFDELDYYAQNEDIRWKLISKDKNPPYTEFYQYKGEIMKIKAIFKDAQNKTLQQYFIERQRDWNTEIKNLQHSKIDSNFYETQNLSWITNNKVLTISYKYLVIVDGNKIYKSTENVTNDVDSDTHVKGEALQMITVEQEEVTIIWRHCNQVSKTYFYPYMTGEVNHIENIFRNLNRMVQPIEEEKKISL